MNDSKILNLQLDNISSYKEDNNNIYYFLDTVNDNNIKDKLK
jgi:hypothetical protein